MKALKLILRRPASVLLIVFAVLVFGVGSLMGMPLEYMPDMEMPMELVMVMWPGADADSIERLVTEEVEDVCETMTDINTVSSTTYDNYTMVQLSYNYSVDLDDAYMELKAAMDSLAIDLPEGCEDPTILEISADAMATMSVSVTAAEGAQDVQGYLEDTVTPTLESIAGVAKVDLSGAREEYLRVVLDEEKLEQYGLTITSVGSAIAAADFDMPVGSVAAGSQDVALSAYGDVEISTSDFRSIPVQTASGQIIRLGDVTTFLNRYQEDAESISRYNGQESILLEVTKADSASTIAVCADVEESLEELSSAGGFSCEVVSSQAENVMDSLVEVVKTLVIGVALTMAVLLVFFGDWRASLVVGCSMPLSVLLAMILLCMLGFSFDMMTGTSLVIAIGMIVDNAIVVLESCMRSREQGLAFKEAAAQGCGSVLLSIFAGTLTTVVVYVPLAMADGMSGQMAGPLSWTISLTMLSSFLCAVTVVPLAFSLIKPTPKKDLPVNRVLSRVQGFYRRVTPSLLRHPGRALAGGVALLLCSLLLAGQLDFVMFPNDYDGSIQVEAVFRSGTRLEAMDQRVSTLEEALLSDENFERVTLSISDSAASLTAYARDGSKRTSEEAVETYIRQFGSVAGMDVTVTPTGVGDMAALMGGGNTEDITLAADDLNALKEATAQVAETMAQVPGVLKIDDPFARECLQGRLVIDAQKALALGLSQSGVAMQINYLLNGMTAATIDYGDKEYDVVLEYPEGRYDTLTALLDRPIASSTGMHLTVGDVAEVRYENALPSITRQDGRFVATVSATLAESADDAAAQIGAAVKARSLPEGVEESMSAMDKTTQEEMSGMAATLLTAVFLVFLVMAVQFNSPRLSLMVMLCIPFSLAGSFGFMFLTGQEMSIMGLMGFLMLFGIVVNNGILLVDATNQLRQTMPLGEALVEAGVTRLRPILMTTLTTILSMVPLILSTSSSLGMMSSMGYIIIGGLAASTVLTLFLMPPFYLLIRGERPDGSRRKRRKKEEKAGKEQQPQSADMSSQM